jgi:hypothetical protein
MPLSLKDLNSPAVAAAEAALEAAKRQAVAEAEQARRDAEQAEREAADAEKRAARRVAELSKQTKAALAEARRLAAQADRPPWRIRRMSREWLRGALPSPGELLDPDVPIRNADPALAILHGALQPITAVLEWILDDAIIVGGPSFDAADRLEAQVWREYVGRMRELAGEG